MFDIPGHTLVFTDDGLQNWGTFLSATSHMPIEETTPLFCVSVVSAEARDRWMAQTSESTHDALVIIDAEGKVLAGGDGELAAQSAGDYDEDIQHLVLGEDRPRLLEITLEGMALEYGVPYQGDRTPVVVLDVDDGVMAGTDYLQRLEADTVMVLMIISEEGRRPPPGFGLGTTRWN
jgi:hypothetical protein